VPTVNTVYYGLRDDMVAEVGAWNPLQVGISAKECKYLVLANGSEQFDTEWFSNRKDARAAAKQIASHYGAKVSDV